MKHLRASILIWLVSGLVSPLCADLFFEDDAPLEIQLSGPVWSLIDNKEDRNEWPFRLKSGGVELGLMLSARGNSRMRVCDFPPLKFNFKQAETRGTPFEGQDKLKLVARCRKGDRFEIDVLEEYAAYRIFSLLSDVSYRTRLVHLTYDDTDGRLKEAFRTSYGFLIEPLDQLVSRLDGSLSKLPAVALRQMDKEQAAIVYVFQYLIANTDWSFVAAENDEYCCHNIELVKLGNQHFPVPFDFDIAGLVNAIYARPDASLRIKKVSQRLYRGFCTDTETLRGALRRITSKEEEIKAVIAGLPKMEQNLKDKRMAYLGGFFKKAHDEDKMISMFEIRCHS